MSPASYTAWDPVRQAELQEVFRLPMDRRVGGLSPAAPAVPVAHGTLPPAELLLIDEPGTSMWSCGADLMDNLISLLHEGDSNYRHGLRALDQGTRRHLRTTCAWWIAAWR